MSQVSGRRTDQLGDLVAVLELGAVDLDDRARILQQRLGGRFDDAGLSRAGRPQEQEVPDRAARGAHPRQMHLIDVDDLLDRLILPDDHPPEVGLQGLASRPVFAGSNGMFSRTILSAAFLELLGAAAFLAPLHKLSGNPSAISLDAPHPRLTSQFSRAVYLFGLGRPNFYPADQGSFWHRKAAVRTISATSSGQIFQLHHPVATSRPLNSVATLPGMM